MKHPLWLRTIGISILKWVTLTAIGFVVAGYLLANVVHGYALSAIMWLITLIVCYFFSEWVFAKSPPDRRTVVWVIIIWFIVTFTLEIAWEIYLVGSPVFFLHSPDVQVQFVIELLAILLAAYHSRRRQIMSVLGEGMVE